MPYNKQKRRDTMRKRSMDYDRLMPRIFGKVNITETCWLWEGSKNSKGYGMICYGGKNILLHRLIYSLAKAPLKNLCVLHRCDVPACINPDHLFLGTKSDNMKDCANKKRQHRQKYRKLYCAKGHMMSGDNVFSHKCSRNGIQVGCRECRKEKNKKYRQKLKAIKTRYGLEG